MDLKIRGQRKKQEAHAYSILYYRDSDALKEEIKEKYDLYKESLEKDQKPKSEFTFRNEYLRKRLENEDDAVKQRVKSYVADPENFEKDLLTERERLIREQNERLQRTESYQKSVYPCTSVHYR